GKTWHLLGRDAPRAVLLGELDVREPLLALDDALRAVAALLLDQVVERPRLLDVLSDVRDRNRPDLAVLCQAHRELCLLDRGDDTLRVRYQLLLAQPAGRLRGGDEPFGVLRAHVAVDPDPDRLGAQLGDRVTRVDALRAALLAEVAARAVPYPVLGVVGLQPLDGRLVAGVAHEAHAL